MTNIISQVNSLRIVAIGEVFLYFTYPFLIPLDSFHPKSFTIFIDTIDQNLIIHNIL